MKQVDCFYFYNIVQDFDKTCLRINDMCESKKRICQYITIAHTYLVHISQKRPYLR